MLVKVKNCNLKSEIYYFIIIHLILCKLGALFKKQQLLQTSISCTEFSVTWFYFFFPGKT